MLAVIYTVFEKGHFCKIRPRINPVKTKHMVLVFSSASFGVKGHHHRFEQNSKRIYVHSVYGIAYKLCTCIHL